MNVYYSSAKAGQTVSKKLNNAKNAAYRLEIQGKSGVDRLLPRSGNSEARSDLAPHHAGQTNQAAAQQQ